MNKTSKQLGIIYPSNIGIQAVIVSDLFYTMFPIDKIELYKTRSHFIFVTELLSRFSNSIKVEQEEFPMTSLDWVIKNLEFGAKNTPLKNPRESGDVTVSADFSEESIGLSPSRHCCAENNPGYSLWNKSRRDYIAGVAPQAKEIPRDMIITQFIPSLKLCK